MLTGKTKEGFEKWLVENHNKEVVLTTCSGDYEGGCFEYDITLMDLVLDYDKIPYLLEGLVIDFFDSVGIYIDIGVFSTNKDDSICFSGSFFGILGGWDDGVLHENRQEATEQAIIHANKIYNERV